MDEASQAVQISLLSLNTFSRSFSPLQTFMQMAFQEHLILHLPRLPQKHYCPFSLEPSCRRNTKEFRQLPGLNHAAKFTEIQADAYVLCKAGVKKKKYQVTIIPFHRSSLANPIT